MNTKNMIRCQKCGYYCSADTKGCPECGAIITSGRFAMVKYIMLVLLALLILFLIGGYDKKVEPVEPTEPVAPAEPKETSKESAIYSQLYDVIACNQASGRVCRNIQFQSQVVVHNRIFVHKRCLLFLSV